MKQLEFKELLKEEKDLQKIIYKHCHLKIYLNNKQIDEVLKKRNKQNRKRDEEEC